MPSTSEAVGPTTLSGVLVCDKPAGMTSHDVVAVVRRSLGGRGRGRGAGRIKVGHTGTLDPDATGVLVVLLGRATRLAPFLAASTKTYDARMCLGVRTTTLDAAGAVVSDCDALAIDEQQLCEALKSFLGEGTQIPPMVSAVKVDGERLYAKARRGESIERTPRAVTINDVVLSDFEPGRHPEAGFLVTCSAGTYVRSLVADIGDGLGVGAHLVALRRLGSGRFSLEQAASLDEIVELGAADRLFELLVPPAAAVADYPKVQVPPAAARDLGFGRPLAATGHEGPVAVLDDEGQLLAMVADSDGLARALVVLAPAAGKPGERVDG